MERDLGADREVPPDDEVRERRANETDRVREWSDPPYEFPETVDEDADDGDAGEPAQVNESDDPKWPFPQ